MDVFKAGREAWQDALARIDAEQAAVEQNAAQVDAEAAELLATAEAESRELSSAEQARFDQLLAERESQNTRAAELRAEERAATETALGLRQAFATAKPAASRVADARNGVLFDQTGRAIGDVFQNSMGRKMESLPVVKRTRLQAFTGPDAERNAYRSGMWLRVALGRSRGVPDDAAEQFCQANGVTIAATHRIDPGSAGGYLVPNELSRAFIEFREAVGVSRRVAMVVPMSADTMDVPKLASGPAVRYPGEAQEITESDQNWQQLSLVAKKRAILSRFSSELRDDALINVVDQLVSRAAFEFALQEDREFINGDGTSSYGGTTGLLAKLGAAGLYTAGGSATSGRDTWPEILIDDITGTMGLLPTEHVPGAVFICSGTFYYGVLLKILAASGGNTVASLMAGDMDGAGSAVKEFLGRPVYLTDQMPVATGVTQVSLLFGNFRNACLIGDRQALQMQLSEQRYFEFDMVGARLTTRYDINVHEGGTASAVGAYVGLRTATS